MPSTPGSASIAGSSSIAPLDSTMTMQSGSGCAGHDAAGGPVPIWRVPAGAHDGCCLLGRLHVRHDDPLAAEVQGAADVGRVRVPDPAERGGSGQPDRGGQRGQVVLGRGAVLEVDDDIVEAAGRQQAGRHRPGAAAHPPNTVSPLRTRSQKGVFVTPLAKHTDGWGQQYHPVPVPSTWPPLSKAVQFTNRRAFGTATT